MARTFPGFPKQAMTFFRQLERNNKREWFQPRKAIFEKHVRGPMLDLLGFVTTDMRSYAADYAAEPKKTIYRIYRDTRFSKDKTPYKTYIAAMFFRPGIPKNSGAGFYFSVSHDSVEIAAGAYMPSPEELAAIRAAIAKDKGKSLRKLLAAPALKRLAGKLLGTTLSRVPKGFEPDHPAADWLRMKQMYFVATVPAKVALTSAIRKEITTRFRAMAPIVHYLNNAILEAQREREETVERDAIPKRPTPMF
jgi:uncharacterized protein (TIGR02453 family)